MRTSVVILLVFITKHVMGQYEPDIGNGELLVAFRGIQDSSKEVSIQAISTVYDKNFQVITADTAYQEKSGLVLRLNAGYDAANVGTHWTIYYGKYLVRFWQIHHNQPRTQLGSDMVIDFRDADYNNDLVYYAYNGTGQKDFFALMDYDNSGNSTPGGSQATQYFRYGPTYQSTSLNTSIWVMWNGRFDPDKTQNQLAFQNFKLTTQGIGDSPSYTIAINGSNYAMNGNATKSVGLGFSNPLSASITVPSKLPSNTPNRFSWFSTWDGNATYNTNNTVTFDGNLSKTVTANYVSTYQNCVLGGPTTFSNGCSPFYLASLGRPDLFDYCTFEWRIKYDAIGVWQTISTSWVVTITPPQYNSNYNFELQCIMKDQSLKITCPSNIIRVTYAPPLSDVIIYGSTSCITQFSTVTWYADPSGGDGAYTYQWKKGNSVVGTGPSVSLYVTGGFRLHLTVSSGDYCVQSASTYKDISTSGCGGGGGCPFVFIESDTGLVQDNNILNKSEFEENVGVDITDRYRLNVKPSLKGGQYRLSIQELNDDHSYFDAFRLYAVDHPEGTDIGITENNDIVLLYPSCVESASDARMHEQDLSGAIGFSEAFGLTGQKSDTLRLKFKQDSERIRHWSSVRSSHRRDSLAFLAKVGDVGTNALPGPKDEFAFVSDGSSSYSLSGRESSSSLILPIASIPDAMTIVWNRDYTVRDIGLTRVFYDGFIQRELPLAEAVHSHKGRIRRELSDADGKYGELLSGETITLAFNSNAPLRQGYVRDFVLETTGRYTGHQSRTSFRKSESTKSFVPTKFELVGNYPNPFNPTTSIVYDIADRSDVRISIFNSLGQLVREFNEGVRAQGRYTLTWDGKNDAGKQAPSGVYVYQLTAGQFVQTKKMTLVK